MELDLYFVREKLMAKQLLVQQVLSLDQVAEILTKPLSTTHFKLLNSKLSVVSPAILSLRGSKKDNIVLRVVMCPSSHQLSIVGF